MYGNFGYDLWKYVREERELHEYQERMFGDTEEDEDYLPDDSAGLPDMEGEHENELC